MTAQSLDGTIKSIWIYQIKFRVMLEYKDDKDDLYVSKKGAHILLSSVIYS